MDEYDIMSVLSGDKTAEDALGLGTDTTAAPAATDTTAPAAATDTTVAPAVEPVPEVLAKDGKNTIPFTVVEGLRQTEQRLRARIAELEQTPAAVPPDLPALSAEDLELMREEFPNAVKRLEALEQQAARTNELEQQLATHTQAAQQTAAQTAQAAIDAIPKLAHIQTNNPELFAEACKLDQVLQGRPDTAALPLQERFAKALAATEVMYGEIVIPGAPPAVKPTAPAPAPVTATPPPIPNSLSDLPAGSPPIHDPLGVLTATSTPTLLDHFHGKTPEQIHAEIRSII